MADYKFEKPKFDLQTKELYKKFTKNSIADKTSQLDTLQITVPFESLDLYMKNIWSTIRNCKDIDVPSQRILISEYRCNVIKNELLKDIIVPGFQKLDVSLSNIYPGLKVDSENLIKLGLEKFEERTSFYLEDVVARYKQEIHQILKDNLLKFLRRQIKLIKLYVNGQVDEKSKRLRSIIEKKPTQFYKEWIRSRDSLIFEAKDMLQKSNVQFLEYDMDKTTEEIVVEINKAFDELFQWEIKIYTESFFKKELQKTLNDKITSLFGNPKILFWEEFNNFFSGLWKKLLRTYEDNLKEGFNLQKKDLEQHVLNLRNEVRTFVTEKIYERKALFNQYVKEM